MAGGTGRGQGTNVAVCTGKEGPVSGPLFELAKVGEQWRIDALARFRRDFVLGCEAQGAPSELLEAQRASGVES